jgi:hypothetical protein
MPGPSSNSGLMRRYNWRATGAKVEIVYHQAITGDGRSTHREKGLCHLKMISTGNAEIQHFYTDRTRSYQREQFRGVTWSKWVYISCRCEQKGVDVMHILTYYKACT